MRKYPIPKRLGASLICFALILSLLPAGALAADGDTGFSWTLTGGPTDEATSGTDVTLDKSLMSGNLTVRGGSGESITVTGFGGVNVTLSGNITSSGDISCKSMAALNITEGNIDVGGNTSSEVTINISGGHVTANSIAMTGLLNGSSGFNFNITGGVLDVDSITVQNSGTGHSTFTVNGSSTVVFADTVSVTAGGTSSKNYQNGVVFEGNDGTVYGAVTLPDDLIIPEGYTLTIPDDASLTVPNGTELTVDGTLVVDDGATLTNNGVITGAGDVTVNGDVEGTGSMNVTGTVTKKAQTTPPNAPASTFSFSETSVTLNPVSSTGGVGGIEYGYTTGDEEPVPDDRWQKDTTFDNLSPGTDYTFYARYAGNDYYAPSPASSGFTVTTLPDITTASLDAGYVGVSYSATLHASADNGKAVTWALADGSTLPGNLNLNSDGTITGIPTAAATNHSFTVQATIKGGQNGT